MIRKMDLRGRSLGKVEKWVKKRSRQAGKDVTDEEAAAYYMFEFDFEDRMKSWMPFDKYATAQRYMEAMYPEFRRCTNCPDADPDAKGTELDRYD
jgi:hypothetical protein